MNNITALPAGKSQFSLTPQTLDEALRFADILSKSSIVPKDYQGNPGNVIVAIQWGAELGLPPLQAMQNIAVINDRPSIWGDAMIALVKGSGLLESMDEAIDETECTCTVKRSGEEPVSRSYTMEDAKRAGLAGKSGPWQQYPKRMLQMRARAWALRDVFPDVLRGVYVAEESQDMPAERDITAESEQIKPAKSRIETVKAALADRRKESVSVPPMLIPAVADVLAAIQAATTPEALKSASELAGRLEADTDKAQAREAYKVRNAEIKAAAKQDSEPERAITFAMVANAINKADDQDALDIAADLIGKVVDPGHRAELSEMCKARQARDVLGNEV
jgi:hypothetical protein